MIEQLSNEDKARIAEMNNSELVAEYRERVSRINDINTMDKSDHDAIINHVKYQLSIIHECEAAFFRHNGKIIETELNIAINQTKTQ